MNPRADILQPLPHQQQQQKATTSQPSRRCRVAAAELVGSQAHADIARLLHARLRVVVLISLLPLLAFLVLRLANYAAEPRPLSVMGFHLAVTVFHGLLAWLLWWYPEMPLCRLRNIELALFG